MDDPAIASCAVELRPYSQHGRTQVGGLTGIHHFCFATFQRLDRVEWGALRGLNEYRLAPGAIRHPTFHAGFDIVTLVVAGSLRRIGTYAPRQLLTPGSIEVVSAGRGVDLGVESCGTEPASYVELWIRTGPGLREPKRQWLGTAATGVDRPMAAGLTPRSGSLKLRARASVARASHSAGERLGVQLDIDECAYVWVRSGALVGSGHQAAAGDAFAATGPGMLGLIADHPSDILLIRTSQQF
jgi:redox-sensitive bicupin YhaK (pirin superfamily)